jgi:nucleoside-diphosphate-sugar epimerase
MYLVTGGTGFIGNALLLELARTGKPAVAAIRNTLSDSTNLCGFKSIVAGEISPETDWRKALEDVSVVMHCAARVHVMREASKDPLGDYRRVNTFGTLNLAKQAADHGVRRFVFVSSIKVNGEATQAGHPFSADDLPAPTDAYGISKLEAEMGLRDLSAATSMEIVIVRPPLVYGRGVKANFASMMRWLASGIPLPLGDIDNSRSLIALENLVDLLVICSVHPKAAGHSFLASDGEDVSTTELLHRTARAMGRSAYLIKIPTSWLEFGATIIGKRVAAQRLCGSLQVDIEKTRRMLGWTPPLTLDQGLKRAVDGFKS